MDAGMASKLVVPGITNKDTLACLARARKYKQYCKAVEDALTGKCPFCQVDRIYNEVVMEDNFFMVWPCKPAEANTRFHFLIVPKRHVISVAELTHPEWAAIQGYIWELREEYDFTSCGILCRDGDATLSAGTIQHLHIHIMVPDGAGRVESPFFKGKDAEMESLARAIVFEKMRQGGHFESLSPAEKDLVKDRM